MSFIKDLKNHKIDETLVSLLNCENKHVISVLAGFIAGGKWSLGLMPFGLKSFGLIQLVTWPNFLKLSVSGIGHLA